MAQGTNLRAPHMLRRNSASPEPILAVAGLVGVVVVAVAAEALVLAVHLLHPLPIGTNLRAQHMLRRNSASPELILAVAGLVGVVVVAVAAEALVLAAHVLRPLPEGWGRSMGWQAIL